MGHLGMEPHARDEDVGNHPQLPAPNPPCLHRISLLAVFHVSLPLRPDPDSSMSARWLPNCFSRWLRRFRPAAPELAPLLPVAEPAAAPAPAPALGTGSGRVQAKLCWFGLYFFGPWFLIFLVRQLAFPEMSWEQFFGVLFVFECLALVAMEK